MTLLSRSGYRLVDVSIAAVTTAALLVASPGILSAATDPDGPAAGDDLKLAAAAPTAGW